MVPAPLFSTYRSGENRVTASTMAVFERIDLALVQELLSGATGSGDELRAVTFENQITGPGSVPDARISGRFAWWFETKTERGAYAAEGHGRTQLREHAHRLEDDTDARLFVLTPDPVRPAWFDDLDGVAATIRDRVLWLGFRDLADQITAVVQDPSRLIGEQVRFLLAELVALFETDGLLAVDDVVVVAARTAWPDYLRWGAYVCQPDRSFRQGLTHFGFYTDGAVQYLVPKIRRHLPSVMFSPDEVLSLRAEGDDELADLIDSLVSAGRRNAEESHGVVLLTAPDDPQTVDLGQIVANDTETAGGKAWAWTLSQRYTQLSRLRRATVTSDL
jgi:hypothetical protein